MSWLTLWLEKWFRKNLSILRFLVYISCLNCLKGSLIMLGLAIEWLMLKVIKLWASKRIRFLLLISKDSCLITVNIKNQFSVMRRSTSHKSSHWLSSRMKANFYLKRIGLLRFKVVIVMTCHKCCKKVYKTFRCE